MKLVDILARELKEWPEHASKITQSAIDGELYLHGGAWIRSGLFFAASHDGADGITRAQWQEAREALSKAASAEWDGVGHPPLGAICEFTQSNSPFARCEVVFSSPWVTVVRGKGFDDDAVDIAVSCMDKDARFRPIRTPEQIAAEERSEFSYVMCKDAGHDSPTRGQLAMAEKLFDAGYRKVNDGNQKA